jgi:ureidoglycolate dehydrogenase (NAD+)
MSEPGAGAAPVCRAADLQRFIEGVFARTGMSPHHARQVAEVLVWADLRGVDTHGAARVPRYIELIEAGDINAQPAMHQRDTGAAAVLIEADRAPGPVAMIHAMEAAEQRARHAGIGMAVVRATTHTAALGYYTRTAALHGMVGIAFSSSQPNMVYHGAAAPGVSTSPLSIGAPGGPGGPVVLDFGAGVVSAGRLVQARKLGQPLPLGWALDAQGRPTTDASRARAPLPMAGPKGAGLSLMIELMSSLLAANPLLAETLEGTPLGSHHRQNAAAIAIDVARFVDAQTFCREVERLARDLKALPRADPQQEILLPGERGDAVHEHRVTHGIPVAAPVLQELLALAQRLGVPPLPVHAAGSAPG